MVLRLVLAEDSFLMRDGINALLELDDEVDVVASCEDYDTLMAAVEEYLPDVVLTDIRMPPSQTDEGIRAADAARRRCRACDACGNSVSIVFSSTSSSSQLDWSGHWRHACRCRRRSRSDFAVTR